MAWLARSIFYEYIHDLNEKCLKEGRKILYTWQLFRSPDSNFSNIEFFFLIKCTCVLQSLDMEIIAAFKARYRMKLNEFLFILKNDQNSKIQWKMLL